MTVLIGLLFVPNTLRAHEFGELAKFVKIPADEFWMGSERQPNEKPLRRVKISKDFWMQTTEVTQAQWIAVMGRNPIFNVCSNCPVEQVIWSNVFEKFDHTLTVHENLGWKAVSNFIDSLNRSSDRHTYRLPTEAEWEYAV